MDNVHQMRVKGNSQPRDNTAQGSTAEQMRYNRARDNTAQGSTAEQMRYNRANHSHCDMIHALYEMRTRPTAARQMHKRSHGTGARPRRSFGNFTIRLIQPILADQYVSRGHELATRWAFCHTLQCARHASCKLKNIFPKRNFSFISQHQINVATMH